MKRFLGTITLLPAVMAVFILGGSAKLVAQEKVRITIPFAFTANHQQLPAGPYYATWLTDRAIQLVNKQTGEAQFLTVRPERGRAIETRSRFVFVQEGKRFYLGSVWMAGTSVHSEMTVQHRPERAQEMANAPAPKTIEIAAR